MKLKTHYTILIVCVAYFCFNSCLPRHTSELQTLTASYMSEGWTQAAAEHIAKVELKMIPEDAEYISYMED